MTYEELIEKVTAEWTVEMLPKRYSTLSVSAPNNYTYSIEKISYKNYKVRGLGFSLGRQDGIKCNSFDQAKQAILVALVRAAKINSK